MEFLDLDFLDFWIIGFHAVPNPALLLVIFSPSSTFLC